VSVAESDGVASENLTHFVIFMLRVLQLVAMSPGNYYIHNQIFRLNYS
jgi:hypothetical protein